MKVLFISNLYPPAYIGGYELNCADVALDLQLRGHDVRVITSDYLATKVTHAEPTVSRRLRLRQDWDRSGSTKTIGKGLANAAAQWHNVRSVRRFVDQFHPDIIVCWNAMHLGHSLPVTLQEFAPTVYYVADAWLTGLLTPQAPRHYSSWRQMYHKILSVIGLSDGTIGDDHVVFCSGTLRNFVESMGVKSARGTIIHPGISFADYDERPQQILERADNEQRRILFFGQISRDKGVITAVDALRHVKDTPDLYDTRLTLLGNVRDEQFNRALHARIAELDIEGSVDIVPRRPRREVIELFDEHDVFIFPTEGGEPFGLALVEAMAVGLPVVATSRGGPSEIVRDGETGILFQAGDARDLADKISKALRNPEYAANLGRAAAYDVRTRFSIEQQTSGLEQFMISKLESDKP